MTSTGYHDVGEEWAQKWAFRQDQISRDTGFDILLYDDSTDSLSDSSDVGDISTEPSSGNYARQTATLDGSDITLSQSSSDLQAQATVTFDVTDTDANVDAWGSVNDFKSDVVNSEASSNTHLISTASFSGGTKDLSNFTSLDVTVNLTLD